MKTRMLLGLFLVGILCTIPFGVLYGEENRVTKQYDVLDIVLEIPSYSSSPLIMTREETSPPQAPTSFCTGDDLANICNSLILNNMPAKDTCCNFQSPYLVVRNTTEVHKRIEMLLAYLRQIRNRMIAIETKLVVVDNANWREIKDRLPDNLIIDEKLLQNILEKGEIYKTAQKTAYNGQRVYIRDSISTIFARDYRVTMVQPGEVAADPQPASLDEGIVLDIQPFVNPSGNEIQINTIVEASELVSMEKFDVQSPVQPLKGLASGLYDLPQVKTTNLQTTVIIPDKKTMVIARANIKGTSKSILILMTPTISKLDDEKSLISEISLSPEKSLKIIDVADLTYPAPNYPAPNYKAVDYRLNLNYDTSYPPYPPFSGQPYPTPPQPIQLPLLRYLDLNTIIDLVKSNIQEGDWDNFGKIERFNDQSLLLINNPTINKKVINLLSDLSKSRSSGQLVKVGTSLLEVDDGYWQKLNADKKGSVILSPQMAKEMLTEAEKGEKALLLTSSEIIGLNGQRVNINQGEVKNYIKDFDVISGALALDPILDTMFSGTILEVYPVISNPKSINVWVNFIYKDLLKLEVIQGKNGWFHKPQTRNQSFIGNVTVPNGGWVIGGVTSFKDINGKLKHVVTLINASIVK